MNYRKVKKSLIASFFVGLIFIGTAMPIVANGRYGKNEIIIEKSDSTKTKASNQQTSNSSKKEAEIKKQKSPSNLSYNFIFYLISKFIEAYPIYRSR